MTLEEQAVRVLRDQPQPDDTDFIKFLLKVKRDVNAKRTDQTDQFSSDCINRSQCPIMLHESLEGQINSFDGFGQRLSIVSMNGI